MKNNATMKLTGRTFRRSFYALALLLSLSSCTVYTIDIQQGNEITKEMLAEIKIGMNKEDVRKLFGLPLVIDPFHKDRWDYYFYLKKGETGVVSQQSATLHFEDDLLVKIHSTLD